MARSFSNQMPSRTAGSPTRKAEKKFQTMEPKWFDGEFSRLIEIAFLGRIITTQQEAAARLRKTPRREITEDD